MPAHGELRPVENMRKEHRHFSSNAQAAVEKTEQKGDGAVPEEADPAFELIFVCSLIPSFICYCASVAC